jgi:hypothetical protein
LSPALQFEAVPMKKAAEISGFCMYSLDELVLDETQRA